MSEFSDRLSKAMINANIDQGALSKMTGISRSGISQYLSGKNEPGKAKKVALANALSVSIEWLDGVKQEIRKGVDLSVRIPVETAAKMMGVSKKFIRVGLQQGILPFGFAIKISGGKFTYYISPKKLAEYVESNI